MEQTKKPTKTHEGSCHCGKVKFKVDLDADLRGGKCNCSICTKTNVTSALVKPSAFTLLAGESDLGSYAWGAKISTRYFCKHCGVQCFGKGFLEEVGGDFVGINLNTIDAIDLGSLPLTYWDGRHDNWEGGPRETPWPINP